MTRTIAAALAYIDDQDPADIGWAYRITYNDGHEESGAMDAASEDESAVQGELEALVSAYGGDWTEARFQVVDGGGDCYVWAAPEKE